MHRGKLTKSVCMCNLEACMLSVGQATCTCQSCFSALVIDVSPACVPQNSPNPLLDGCIHKAARGTTWLSMVKSIGFHRAIC